MKLTPALRQHVLACVRNSHWFLTAPAAVQPSLKIEAVTLENQIRRDRYTGDSEAVVAIVAQVHCGEESRRFAFTLGAGRDLDK